MTGFLRAGFEVGARCFFCLCKQAGVLAGAIFRFGPLIARAAFGGSCCLWKQLAFLRARLRFASLRLRAPDRAKGTKVSPAGSVSALLCATGTRRPQGGRLIGPLFEGAVCECRLGEFYRHAFPSQNSLSRLRRQLSRLPPRSAFICLPLANNALREGA